MQEISRFSAPSVDVVCTNVPGTSARIPFSRGAGGVITVGATAGSTQIQWYAAPSDTATPVPIFSGGNAVTTALTVGAHPFPDATFGCHTVVPVVNGISSVDATITIKG